MQSIEAKSSEDCLFLNIYTPTNALSTSTKKSVMFWIHGGSYISGTIFSGEYNATYLSLVGDVVVVEVNYRLSVFGFFYDGTDNAPGNQALFDHLLALRWVRDNIDKFGGNPNSVTIFGQSAGSMAVGSLILIRNETLFHRAIMESGSPNSYIGSEPSDNALAKAKRFAANYNCLDNTTDRINMSCLRKVDAYVLANYSRKISNDGDFFTPIYGDKLQPIRPSLALQNGDFRQDIQILFGTCADEGSGFVAEYVSDLKANTPPNTMTLSKAKLFIQLLFTGLKVPFAKNVSDFYTANLTDSDGTLLKKAVSNAFGDYQLTCPLVLFGSEFALKSDKNKAYAYKLTYSRRNASIDWTGVRHSDELQYVFGRTYRVARDYTLQELNLGKTIVDVWSTFAKTG
jgi:carboxylesterase type B